MTEKEILKIILDEMKDRKSALRFKKSDDNLTRFLELNRWMKRIVTLISELSKQKEAKI